MNGKRFIVSAIHCLVMFAVAGGMWLVVGCDVDHDHDRDRDRGEHAAWHQDRDYHADYDRDHHDRY